MVKRNDTREAGNAKRGAVAALNIPTNQPSPKRLLPPPGHVIVRLYRIGHGDCFLLAFPAANGDKASPVYVLIDCGFKPGSPNFLATNANEVVANIKAATGGHIHVAVVTHEHQDHINGFTESNFEGIKFGECWFAWTENPEDEFAQRLRRRFADRIKHLHAASLALAAAGGHSKRIDELLALELGGEVEDRQGVAALAGGVSSNQRAMQLVRRLADDKVRYLEPHGKALELPDTKGVKVFPLGPPKDEKLLHSLDPEGDEGFPEQAFAKASVDGFFVDAVNARAAKGGSREPLSPFDARYGVALSKPVPQPDGTDFLARHYGGNAVPAMLCHADSPPAAATTREAGNDEVPDDAPWRRIDHDWLQSADELALAMNNDTNNGSLVLAFELGGEDGKVLLFAADAQRGNWISWSMNDWRDGDRVVTARDLLARTVLYKVGHHGSHNATLSGEPNAVHPCLGWMGRGEHAAEFTAMLTAVREWAKGKAGWNHPLPAIKAELVKKTGGRVFQTDTDLDRMAPAGGKADWEAFLSRAAINRLYMDYSIAFP